MNVLLLLVALAAPVEAPKAELHEVAAASAAVASVQVVPEAHRSPLAIANAPTFRGMSACVAAKKSLAPLPEPKTGTGCDLVSLFETRRFLSAPWSASRRLKAARLRGDKDEARRMEARLGELVEEALGEIEN